MENGLKGNENCFELARVRATGVKLNTNVEAILLTFIKNNSQPQYFKLVCTTQVNSAFRALRLVNSEVISKYYSPPSSRRERCWSFRPLVTLKIMFWSANYSACVAYTKTIIHLSVGESDGYLPSRDLPPLR